MYFLFVLNTCKGITLSGAISLFLNQVGNLFIASSETVVVSELLSYDESVFLPIHMEFHAFILLHTFIL